MAYNYVITFYRLNIYTDTKILNIVVITGSNNKNSKTKEVIDKILEKVCKIDDRYSYDNIIMGKLTLNYCAGRDHYFKSGYCKIDEHDDMSIIRKNLITLI